MKKASKRRVKKFLKSIRQKDNQMGKALSPDAKASQRGTELSTRKRGAGERQRAGERMYPTERAYPERMYPEDRMYPVDRTTQRFYPGEREYPAGRPYPEMRRSQGERVQGRGRK
jgi:hypothetical protein